MKFNNPGIYDQLCTDARIAAKASGAVLIVFDGEFDNGFSIQLPLSILMILPDVLEQTAKQIRIDIEDMKDG